MVQTRTFPGGVVVVTISTERGTIETYLREEDEEAIVLAKESGERYTVRGGTCTCKGFLRWGRCKHLEVK